MSVSSQICRASGVGAAAVLAIPYTFPATASSDLLVIQRVISTGVETTLIETTGYTATYGSTGGTVTTVNAIAATDQVHVIRNTPMTQTLDLEAGGAFSAENIEAALDRNTKLIIENADAIRRSLIFPGTDPTGSIAVLPNSIDRAGKYLYFGAADGAPTAASNVTTGAATISAFGATLIDDTSKYAGRTTLGPMFDVKAYGALGDGTTDDSGAFTAAIAAAVAAGGGTVYVPASATAYNIAGTTITMSTNVNLIGDGYYTTIISYTGTGYAISAYGSLGTIIEGLYIKSTALAGGGITIGRACRHVTLRRCLVEATYATAANRTGIGLYLDNITGAFSGGLLVENCYFLGWKNGVKIAGILATGFTCTTFLNTWVHGEATPIAGGVGFWCDAPLETSGLNFIGGYIGYFVTGILVDDAVTGGNFTGLLMEGTTTLYTVGNAFNGTIQIANTPTPGYFRKLTNAAANVDYQEQHTGGENYIETYYDQKHVIYHDSDHEFSVYNGASLIDSGAPTLKAGWFTGGGTDLEAGRNYMYLVGRYMSWDSSAPNIGTWSQGSIAFNTGASANGTVGWVATTDGTFSAATDATGDTDGSTAVITGMADTSDFAAGQFVTVSAGMPSASTPYKIISVDSATQITLNTASDSAQSNVTIATPNPTFVAFGPIAANSISLLSTTTGIDMKTQAKTTLYTVPAGKVCYITHMVVRDPSATLNGGTDYDFGTDATGTTHRQAVSLTTLTTANTDYMVIDMNNVKVTECAAASVFGIYAHTGSTGAATATIDVFGYLI